MNDQEFIPLADSMLPTAHQMLIDDEGNPELLAQGWEKRFVTDDTRLAEAVQLYKDLGFEVHTELLKAPERYADCESCQVYAECSYLTVYVRKPSGEASA